MDKIKIYVACHKPGEVYQDSVYTPIHVGRAISKYKKEMAGMIGDNTGENISEKNASFCELTAQYWAWKNIDNTEYIGFCHYRRGFEIRFSENNIEQIFGDGTDVVLAGPVLRDKGRFECLKTYVGSEDLAIMLWVVKSLYPGYYDTVSDYANGIIDYPFNMLVCKKSLFNEYAKWIFNILFECEKYIQPAPYSRARRVYGYLSEFLMPAFFIHKQCKIKAMRYTTDRDPVRGGISKSSLIKLKLMDWIYWRGKKKPRLGIDNAIRLGLAADGIIEIGDF